MLALLKTNTGRLRILGFFEGISLLFLVFIAVPMKYLFDNPVGSQVVGPIHGALFLFYILLALIVAGEHEWKFTQTTWKVLLGSVVPFGSFWVDKKILAPLLSAQK